ncbi:MAG: FadR/GntR family transcriptional regulator [Bacillota bacterium]|nr:FadR/GntR family transcriptional regulator [Bacillota bacterium]
MTESDFVRVKRSRVHEGIVQQLTQLIRKGRLRPGDRLPPERELAETLGVSRSTLRSALRVLEGLRMIESRQGDGTYVAEVDLEQLVAPLAAVLFTHSVLVEDILELRQIIEPPIAEWAAKRARPEDIEELESILAVQARKAAEGLQTAEEDSRFHYAIAEATGNQMVVHLIDLVMSLLAEVRASSLQVPDRQEVSLAGHRSILEGIKDHDQAAALQAMKEHIRRVAQAIESHL